MKTPSNYKWLKIIKQSGWWKMTARYLARNDTIIVYDNWFKLNKARRMSILSHEYYHHIYFNMPFIYRQIWKLIDNWKVIKILNVLWLTKYKKNVYVTEYAKKNIAESFAECWKIQYLNDNYKKIKFNNYADFKMNIASSMLKYFEKEVMKNTY